MGTTLGFTPELQAEILEVGELTPFEEGTEVHFRLSGYREDKEDGIVRVNKNGYSFILPIFEPFGNPDGNDADRPDFSVYIQIPEAKLKADDPKQFKKVARRFNKFQQCLGVTITGDTPLEELVGAKGSVIVGVEEDPEYGRQNTVRKFILPPAEPDTGNIFEEDEELVFED